MAAINVQLTISDAKGDQSVVSIPIPGTTTPADAILFAEQIIPLVEPLISGTLRDARLSFGINFLPWSVAGSTSDLQEKAGFLFRTVGGFIKRITLPAVVESIFSAGSKNVDTADTDVAAFVTAVVDGIDLAGVGGSGVIEPCNSHEEDITALESAVEAWGKARG